MMMMTGTYPTKVMRNNGHMKSWYFVVACGVGGFEIKHHLKNVLNLFHGNDISYINLFFLLNE